MEEEIVETDGMTVAERLRAAREVKGMSLEEVATQTRIPLRHLENLEAGNWDNLPAPTYTVGFAKSYAAAVDLDRAEISEQLRAEMGFTHQPAATTSEVFEPADPARTMPRWLVIGAIAGVVLVILLMTWLNNRSLQGDAEAPANVAVAAGPPPAQQPAAAMPAAQGPVVLVATEQVWLSVYDSAGTSYFSGMMQPGQTFTVPGTALAPLLKTGKPEALRINVGNAVAPPVGPAGKMVSDISLLPGDLLKGGSAPAAAPTAVATQPAPSPQRTAAPARRSAPPPAAQSAPPPTEPPPPVPTENSAD